MRWRVQLGINSTSGGWKFGQNSNLFVFIEEIINYTAVQLMK